MLNILTGRRQDQCDGTTRRDFLKIGALGMGGLMLSDLLRARASANNQPAASARGTGGQL